MSTTATITESSDQVRSTMASGERVAASGLAIALRQTGAMVLDSYRELSARKLFWLSVIISGIAVIVFALIGINDKGLTLFGYNVGIPYVTTAFMTPAFFYKTVFFSLGFSIWLTWVATILALVSTAGIIPEFVASGSIDMSLSKPIGRLRLFFTKYCCALLFVGLQVTVFSVASFLVIGFRGGTWELGLFWAVPLVLLMFSFLYSICTLVGLLTRSAIAALLLTMLFWFSIWIIHTSEALLLNFRLAYTTGVQLHDDRITQMTAKLAEANKTLALNPNAFDVPADTAAAKPGAKPRSIASVLGGLLGNKKKDAAATATGTSPTAGPGPSATAAANEPPAKAAEVTATPAVEGSESGEPPARRPTNAAQRLADLKTPAQLEAAIKEWTMTRDDLADTRDGLLKWHGAIFAAKTLLPKTSETLGLLERVLFSSDELASWGDRNEERGAGPGSGSQRIGLIRVSQARIGRAMQEEMRKRSVWWVLGTSVGFEVIVLSIAGFIFVRRDF